MALMGEVLLKAVEVFAGNRVARRDGTAGAGIAALEMDVTDAEPDDAAIVGSEKLILPKSREFIAVGGRGIRVDFECRAEAEAGFLERDPGEAFR